MNDSTEPEFSSAPINLVQPSQPVAAHVASNDLCMRGKSASFVKHLVLEVGGTLLADGAVAAPALPIPAITPTYSSWINLVERFIASLTEHQRRPTFWRINQVR